MMTDIADLSFERFSAGDHCRWCRHNQLACAPESFAVGPGFEE
jgi:DNA helicase-2/ATP-dependent DNA helicase PcrA